MVVVVVVTGGGLRSGIGTTGWRDRHTGGKLGTHQQVRGCGDESKVEEEHIEIEK